MTESSKKRTLNFTETEKILLIDLVSENKHILENKQTNSETIFIKDKCWEEITNKFNTASSFAHRSSKSLRNCWENIKKRTRKYFAEEKKEFYKTGVGGECQFAESAILNKARDIIRPSVVGTSNDYDTDCFTATSANETPIDSASPGVSDDDIEYIPDYEIKKNDNSVEPNADVMHSGSIEIGYVEKNSSMVPNLSSNSKKKRKTALDANKRAQRACSRLLYAGQKDTRASSRKRIAKFMNLAKSKMVLSKRLLMNEQEKHSIEMAIAEQRWIKEKLEVEIRKTELEIKKAILMREKRNNELAGQFD